MLFAAVRPPGKTAARVRGLTDAGARVATDSRGMVAQALAVIAFAGVQWSAGLQQATSSIYTMRADGTHVARVSAKGAWTDTDPAWSPDGKRIAFGRFDSRGWRLFVMNASGGGLRALTGTRALAEAPTWSPDGRSIAFAALPAKLPIKGTAAQQVYVVNVSSGRIRALTSFKAGAGLPSWSPDGKRIAFAAWPSVADGVTSDIWTIRPDGSGARKLVRQGEQPAWSPDSRRLAFSRDGDIYTVAASGRDPRRVTRTPRAGDTSPSWSSDGKQLVFASMYRAADQRRDDMLLSITTAGGTTVRTIRDSNPQFWMDAPAWKP